MSVNQYGCRTDLSYVEMIICHLSYSDHPVMHESPLNDVGIREWLDARGIRPETSANSPPCTQHKQQFSPTKSHQSYSNNITHNISISWSYFNSAMIPTKQSLLYLPTNYRKILTEISLIQIIIKERKPERTDPLIGEIFKVLFCYDSLIWRKPHPENFDFWCENLIGPWGRSFQSAIRLI